MDGNVNSYFQVIVQNQSSGTSASTDFVATSNAGTDTSVYIDMGINGSNYSQSANGWYVNGPNDGYLYTQGSNLSIGSIGNSATSGNNINFFVGGTNTQNIQAIITSAGLSATRISATFVGNVSGVPYITNPMTSVGDMIYGGVGGNPLALTNGNNGYNIVSTSSGPIWQSSVYKSPQSPTFTYTSGILTRIDYSTDGSYKTFSYQLGLLTSATYVNSGVTKNKTFNYTSGVLISITEK
jgi:hypothetical protein